MTQRDYFLEYEHVEGSVTRALHVDSAIEALLLWTQAVQNAQGTKARKVTCHSMVGGNPATKQTHWEITLYSPGLF